MNIFKFKIFNFSISGVVLFSSTVYFAGTQMSITNNNDNTDNNDKTSPVLKLFQYYLSVLLFHLSEKLHKTS